MPFSTPTNLVLVGGDPIFEENLIAENTGASDDLKPGMLAIKGTADHQVKYAGAAAVNVIGVVDYMHGVGFPDPLKITDAIPEGKPVRLIKNNAVVRVTLANGQSVAKGDKLIAAANGEVQTYPGTPAAGDEEKIIGVAEETVDASGGAKKINMTLVQ